MKRIAALLVVAFLVLTPGLAFGAEGSASLEQLAVEAAHTPEQHAILARYYRGEAEEARAAAQRHERMAATYMHGTMAQRERMQRHCKGIAEKYQAMATEYDDLATLHEEAGKAAE